MSSRYPVTRGAAVGRVLVASVGGYLLAVAFTVGSASALARVGHLSRADAFVVSAMLAFLVWAFAALLAYVAASARRAAAWVLGGAVVLGAVGWALGPLPAAG